MSTIKKSFVGRVLVLAAIGIVIVTVTAAALPRSPRLFSGDDNRFVQTNLVSDIPGLATVTDPQLINPWGISYGATGAFWVSDNGTGVSTLYNTAGAKQGLVVTIPPPTARVGPSAPTGQVFNGTTSFDVAPGKPAAFIFATEDGTISGWNPSVNATNAILEVDNSSVGAVYKGLAMGSVGSSMYLYATNFRSGRVEVYDSNFHRVFAPDSFIDNRIRPGYAPFNIQNMNGMLFVTYALQDRQKHDDVAGPGHGYVDVFDTRGFLVRRLIKRGKLNSPWGMVIAPTGFGRLTGALLVGNFGDGLIHAYDLDETGRDRDDEDRDADEVGTLKGPNGGPIVIDGLWSLIVGNGGSGGDADKVYFSAGPDGEQHGLFGSLQLAP